MSDMISLQGFEATLQELHWEENPQILDDNLPDAFSDWISNMSYEDIGEFAQTYCYSRGQYKNWEQIRDEYWTENFGPLPTKYQPDLRINV